MGTKRNISFTIKWSNINTTISLSHFVGCAAQSDDVCKMSHDRCPRRYESICQQTLLSDITFSLLCGNKIGKSKAEKRFSSKFTGIEEVRRWLLSATNVPGTLHKNEDLLQFPAGLRLSFSSHFFFYRMNLISLMQKAINSINCDINLC